MKNITIFSGAGISEESGIPTFRTGEDSIWSKYDPDIVCNIQSWPQNMEKSFDFFNLVRQEIQNCEPNSCHIDIANLEKKYNVNIITTNIDELHEKSGSTNVIHIHGNIFESCDLNHHHVEKCSVDIHIGDIHPKSNTQLRHNVVMFGEMPHRFKEAQQIIAQTDILIIVGSSLSVYPAAGLALGAKNAFKKYYVDPMAENFVGFECIREKATIGIKQVIENLENED
jgi:NAD-dependent deacetylase